MPPVLDLVVTCTDRKSAPVPHGVRIRDLPRDGRGVPDLAEWRARLEAQRAARIPARRLYQGETWQAVLETERTASLLRGEGAVRLWVVSAGHGLVRADTTVVPYAATFTQRAPDFVGGASSTPLADAGKWWRRLAGARGLTRLAAASARQDGDLLIVLSEAYLAPLRDDLEQAIAGHPRALVMAPAASRIPSLRSAAPPFDARLQATAMDAGGARRPLSGTRTSLNVRAADLLVRWFGPRHFDRVEATAFMVELTERQRPLPRFGGAAHDDDSIRRHIREALGAGLVSRTALLTRFRRDGNKCEARRFARLYDEVAAESAERRTA